MLALWVALTFALPPWTQTTGQVLKSQFAPDILPAANGCCVLLPDGRFVTCSHVIGIRDRVTVVMQGQNVETWVEENYPKLDYAILHPVQPVKLQRAKLAKEVRVGENVVAYGSVTWQVSEDVLHPVWKSFNRVYRTQTVGWVNFHPLGWRYSLDGVAVAARLEHGMSGGGVYNTRGELVGYVDAVGESEGAPGYFLPLVPVKE